MEKEKNNLDFTREDFILYEKMQKKLYSIEEYKNAEKELLNNVKRVLDLRDFMRLIKFNNNKMTKVINKYSKEHKNEEDVKKLLANRKHSENMIEEKYVSAVTELMYVVYEILCMNIFDNDLTELKDWFQLDIYDMVLVNDLIRELKRQDSSNVEIEDILNALNTAIARYVKCAENGEEYIGTFETSFPFIGFIEEEEVKDG